MISARRRRAALRLRPPSRHVREIQNKPGVLNAGESSNPAIQHNTKLKYQTNVGELKPYHIT